MIYLNFHKNFRENSLKYNFIRFLLLIFKNFVQNFRKISLKFSEDYLIKLSENNFLYRLQIYLKFYILKILITSTSYFQISFSSFTPKSRLPPFFIKVSSKAFQNFFKTLLHVFLFF